MNSSQNVELFLFFRSKFFPIIRWKGKFFYFWMNSKNIPQIILWSFESTADYEDTQSAQNLFCGFSLMLKTCLRLHLDNGICDKWSWVWNWSFKLQTMSCQRARARERETSGEHLMMKYCNLNGRNHIGNAGVTPNYSLRRVLNRSN